MENLRMLVSTVLFLCAENVKKVEEMGENKIDKFFPSHLYATKE